MCNSEILHFEQAGYVIRCNDCRKFHLAFGNISMDQEETVFFQFIQVISEHYQQHLNRPQAKSRDIWVSTPYEGLRFLFTFQELENLHEILQKTQLILKAERLLQEL